MTDVERLALMQALYSVIGAEVRTGVPGNLRDAVNDEYTRLYNMTGATSFEVRVNGEKVGTFSYSKVKGRPARTESSVELVDMAALRCCEDDEFTTFISRWVDAHLEELARAYFAETGELVDGMAVVEHEVPAQPESVRPGGTLRIDAAKVAAAMGASLGPAVAGLLIGGE